MQVLFGLLLAVVAIVSITLLPIGVLLRGFGIAGVILLGIISLLPRGSGGRLLLQVFLFALIVEGVYTWVGESVPQLRSEPPTEETIELTGEVTPEKLMEIGKKIAFGKGQCALCHVFDKDEKPTRCPNLFDVEKTAEARFQAADYKGQAKTTEEYLRESLVSPSAYVVEGFGKPDNPNESPMPTIDKPPVGLNEIELIAVIAWLQGKDGGKVTVKPPKEAGSLPVAEAPPAAQPTGPQPPETLITTFGCMVCHKFNESGTIIGPSLWDVGARRDENYIRQKIANPDSLAVEGFPAGLMGPTLKATGFYDKLTLSEFNGLVSYLAGLKGNQ
ncbi:MAG: cytochrome c [Candidatus Tectomicrobia bacterium]|nr:cytochrome c [Candidatus Tectomicrobia bacterium]